MVWHWILHRLTQTNAILIHTRAAGITFACPQIIMSHGCIINTHNDIMIMGSIFNMCSTSLVTRWDWCGALCAAFVWLTGVSIDTMIQVQFVMRTVFSRSITPEVSKVLPKKFAYLLVKMDFDSMNPPIHVKTPMLHAQCDHQSLTSKAWVLRRSKPNNERMEAKNCMNFCCPSPAKTMKENMPDPRHHRRSGWLLGFLKKGFSRLGRLGSWNGDYSRGQPSCYLYGSDIIFPYLAIFCDYVIG